MPFLGIATSGDLDAVRTDLAAAQKELAVTSQCTQVLNGVHVCSIAKYDEVVEPQDFQISQLIESDAQKVCLHFGHIPDVYGTEKAEAISQSIGHGDIPDHYLCVDTSMTKQYFEAMVPPMTQGFLKDNIKSLNFQQFVSQDM